MILYYQLSSTPSSATVPASTPANIRTVTCLYMKGANIAYDEMSYACAPAYAIGSGAVAICTCNRHQFHEHVEYAQHTYM